MVTNSNDEMVTMSRTALQQIANRLAALCPLVMLAVLLPSTADADTHGEDTRQLTRQARQATQELATALKGELQASLQSRGPIATIGQCNIHAPAIAAKASRRHGWKVGRTSLRLRNPDNAPDMWEMRVLEMFEKQQRKGAKVAGLEYGAVVEKDGRRVFRYMRAIPTQPLCLTCHGQGLDKKLSQRLRQLYPDDNARGYHAGDLRGAYTVSIPLRD